MNQLTAIYDAALDPARWVGVLDSLAPTVGAQSAAVMSVELVKRFDYQLHALSSLFIPEIVAEYQASHAHHEAAEFNRLARASVGELVTAPHESEDFEAFFCRPDVCFLREKFGMLHRAGFRLTDDPARVDVLALQYNQSRGNITEAEARVLAVVAPHVAQSVQLAKSFSVLQAQYGVALAMLDRILIGMMLVDAQGRIVLSNSAARSILEANDGLRISVSGDIVAMDVSADSRLRQAIATTGATANGDGSEATTTVLVPRRSSEEDYIVDVSPLRDARNELQTGFAGTLVSVVDTAHGANLDVSQMKAIFALTPAEIDVAGRLLEGLSTSQIADARNVSPETIKSQLRQVYQKTGTKSRAQLVRRILMVLLPLNLT